MKKRKEKQAGERWYLGIESFELVSLQMKCLQGVRLTDKCVGMKLRQIAFGDIKCLKCGWDVRLM